MDTLELARKLIAENSVSPNAGQCQQIIAHLLSASGFNCQHLPFEDVSNLWATHGSGSPCLVFAGHTDVVPPGDNAAWTTPPFSPVIKDGYLYGRGAVDMKGSLAAMVTAAITFVQQNPQHKGTIAFLLTSDEESAAINGTKKVVEYLQQQNIAIDYCIIGEPTSEETVGDTIKNGRRGSMVANIKVQGVQGHVAYPHKVKNPIFAMLPILTELMHKEWDKGNAYFPPTNLQISSLSSTSPVSNVTPHELSCTIPIRFSPEVTTQKIQTEIEQLMQQQALPYTINWSINGEPFLTKPGVLLEAVSNAISAITGICAKVSTSGGTSDGRFIAKMHTQVVELGPINSLMHQVDEAVKVEDLITLSKIYAKSLELLLIKS